MILSALPSVLLCCCWTGCWCCQRGCRRCVAAFLLLLPPPSAVLLDGEDTIVVVVVVAAAAAGEDTIVQSEGQTEKGHTQTHNHIISSDVDSEFQISRHRPLESTNDLTHSWTSGTRGGVGKGCRLGRLQSQECLPVPGLLLNLNLVTKPTFQPPEVSIITASCF